MKIILSAIKNTRRCCERLLMDGGITSFADMLKQPDSWFGTSDSGQRRTELDFG